MRVARAALERETWDSAKWKEWQAVRLSQMLKRASESVPHYRDQWLGRQSGGDTRSPLVLENWPILSKETVRKYPRAFIAEGTSTRRMQLEHTSGTTGTPLELWHSRQTARQWYALMETRWRGWYGISRTDRWGILGGQLVTPIGQTKPPYWVWNAGLSQLYLSSYHLSAETAAGYIQALRGRNITYLWGYASSLFSLALFAHDQHLSTPQFKVIISNAEPLHDNERAVISSVFGCPVRNTYGMNEMVAAAGECAHGRLHLWPEVGVVEIFHDDRDEAVPYGTVGRVICTGLINKDMPLVRYELGDRGALANPEESCPCGRKLPILQSIEGREDDVILTPDNRRIGRIDPFLKESFPIREAQVIQESLTWLRVKVVPDHRYTTAHGERIVEALRERVGKMSVTLECVDRIPRGGNGKFRAVISQIHKSSSGTNGSHALKAETARFKEPFLLKAFHSLPPFARSWAASAHGYSLRTSRYSAASIRLTEEALERDYWPQEKWRTWLEERRVRILRRAALEVPFYQQHWRERRRRGDNASFEVLANWPVLKKESLRMHPEMFLATGCDRRKLHVEHTSGTTGTPLTLWRNRETNQQWYALNDARTRQWNGLSHEHKWGHIGGQPVVPFNQRRPPYWVWNSPLKQLYISCMHISPQSSPAYLAAIKDYWLEYILGYSSSIALLAQSALENGIKVPLKMVMTDSEPLLQNQRVAIEKGFGCPVRETYGMAEIACAASECSAGALHVWPEVGIIELLDEQDQPVAPGQTGRIIATKLLDMDMPLIRYDTQDLAEGDADEKLCSCGRTLPRIRKLLGRNDDVVITRDGRQIVQIDRIFDPCFDIREGQIVQEAIGKFRIRIVPGSSWTDSVGKSLCDALRNLVGDAEISIEMVPQIERTWAGKYRIIISKVTRDRDASFRTPGE